MYGTEKTPARGGGRNAGRTDMRKNSRILQQQAPFHTGLSSQALSGVFG